MVCEHNNTKLMYNLVAGLADRLLSNSATQQESGGMEEKQMKNYAVLSALGVDRVGIADELTEALDSFKISISESRMATLGGQFAIILQISGEAGQVKLLEGDLDKIGSKLGFHLQLQRIDLEHPIGKGLPYVVESYSMDAPGIVHAVTAILKKHNINIEDLETDTSSVP